MLLEVDESLDAIVFGEATNQPLAMLVNPSYEVVGYANIQRAVPMLGEYVDKERPHAAKTMLNWIAGTSPAMTKE